MFALLASEVSAFQELLGVDRSPGCEDDLDGPGCAEADGRATFIAASEE